VITYRPLAKFDKQATVVFIDKDQIKKKKFSFTDKALKDQIALLVQSGQFSGDHGQIFPLLLNKKIILLTGIGTPKDLSPTALRITARKALLSSPLNKAKNLEIVPHDQKDQTIKAVIESILIGTYEWKKYRTKEKGDTSVDAKDREFFVAAVKKKAAGEAGKS